MQTIIIKWNSILYSLLKFRKYGSFYRRPRIWMKRNDIKMESVLPFAIKLRVFSFNLFPIFFQFNSNIILILKIGDILEMY